MTTPIDPTANVLLLVEAATKRLDDLREVEVRRMNDLAECRAACDEKLAEAEAKRLDAIRAVDASAVAAATERATATATVLAKQVETSAETLRTLVSTTAAALAAQLTQLSNRFDERLASVERYQYEGKGKQAVVDPMMVELVEQVKKLSAGSEKGEGKSAGISMAWVVALGAVGLLSTLVGLAGVGVAVVMFLTKGVT